MKRLQICIIGLVALLALPAQGVVPASLPDITIEVSPETPGPSDTLSVTLSGTWPNSCVPEGLDVSIIDGDSIWISLQLPGWNAKGQCPEIVCTQVLTPWEQATDIDPLPAGYYDIYVRAVACQESGKYELLGGLQIQPEPDGTVPEQFEPGQRVVLLENDPPGGAGLKTGHAGIIICRDTEDGSGSILVSWDLWTQGKADLGACVDGTAEYFPPGSVIWVDPTEVMIGRPLDVCGTILQGLEGCIHFETDEEKTYNVAGATSLYAELSDGFGIEFDDRVRIQGVLYNTPPAGGVIRICPQGDGDIYHPIVSACSQTETGCCDYEYQPGDRVVLLVDNPTGPDGYAATGLEAGTAGTVICCNSVDPQFPIYVSWDDWKQGSDQDAPCPEPILEHPAGSGWSMACVQIAPAQEEEPTDPPPDGITIYLGDNALQLQLNGPSSGGGYAYAGCVTFTVELNFEAQLSVEITPLGSVGGDWTATLDPEIVGPGEEDVELCIEVENLDVSGLEAGSTAHVANITLYAAPAP